MANKITYKDKVAIQNDTSIADENKVTDDDMNEIKRVVNTNADEQNELKESVNNLVVNYDKLEGIYEEYILNPLEWNSNLKSSDSGYWFTTKKYKKGFCKSIDILSVSDNEISGIINFYTEDSNNSKQLNKYLSIEFNGTGNINIEVNNYIPFDFYIAIKGEGIGYTTISDSLYYSFGKNKDANVDNVTIPSNLSSRYMHAYKLNMCGLEYLINSNVSLSNKIANIMPKPNAKKYPITFDFIDKKISINHTIYIVTNLSNGFGNFNIASKEISFVNEYNNKCYYILLYDILKKECSISIFANNKMNYSNFDNKLILACIFFDENNTNCAYLSDINKDYIYIKYKNPSIENNIDDSIYNNTIPWNCTEKFFSTKIQQNFWFNCKCTFIGDSICKGEDPENGYLRMTSNIAQIANEYFGFRECINLGIGGCRISDSSQTRTDAIVNRYTDIDSDTDLIVIFAGTNDYNANVDIGSLDDVSDNSKFIPAYYNLLQGIQTNYSNAKILCVTPLQRITGKNKNSKGFILKDYRNAIIQVCEDCSVPYLDLFTELGGDAYNSKWKTNNLPDGLHPNQNCIRNYVAPNINKKIEDILMTFYYNYID